MGDNLTYSDTYECPWVNATESDTNSSSSSEYVFIVCYPVLLIVCTFGNSTNIIVLGTIRNLQSTGVLLLALAVGDLCTLWMQVPQYMFVVTPEIFNANYTFDYVNDYVQGAYIWLQLVFPIFADWILVAFSVGRVRAVVRPLSFHGSSAKKARIVIMCVFTYAAISCLYKGVTQYYLLAIMDIPTFDVESGRPFIRNLPSWLETWNTVNAFYKDIEVIVIFVILFVCNATIIWAIIRCRKDTNLRSTVTDTERKQTSGKAILVSAVSTYLICMLPEAVNEMLGILARYPYCLYDYRMYNVLWRPAQLLMLIPYSVNFYLYFAFSTRFRNDSKATFLSIWKRMKDWREGLPTGYVPGPRRPSETPTEIYNLDSRRGTAATLVMFNVTPPQRQFRKLEERSTETSTSEVMTQSGGSIETTDL